MKLSKLYSNRPEEFKPIHFQTKMNVIFAEIREHQKNEKDTHNLGKTTFGQLLDFCFLNKAGKDFFLSKNIFKDFTFFLEIQLFDESYLTIKRSAEKSSKISFKKHLEQYQDFSSISNEAWDHVDISLNRAKNLLDSLLNWRSLEPHPYRSLLNYLLRSQGDFSNVFQLQKFKGKHAQWKPVLSHILGFNDALSQQLYEKEDKLKEILDHKKIFGTKIEDSGKITALLKLKQKEAENNQKFLDEFSFHNQDMIDNKEIVEKIDQEIAHLNQKQYSLSLMQEKIIHSLEEERILFDPQDAEKLFKEVGRLFPHEIKHNFEQLITFNEAITEERKSYLIKDKEENESTLKTLEKELTRLDQKRSKLLSSLTSSDSINKYKQFSSRQSELYAEIKELERQNSSINEIEELERKRQEIEKEKNDLKEKIKDDLKRKNEDFGSLFSNIQQFFDEIIKDVLSQNAILSTALNKEGHIEFSAELVDDTGTATNADRGSSYRKLLCIAFDLAILRAHLPDLFPRFVFHDGALEALDDRKKENLLITLREYNEAGIQTIITLINSDLPDTKDINDCFEPSEIIVNLHDKDESGRLFKMPSW